MKTFVKWARLLVLALLMAPVAAAAATDAPPLQRAEWKAIEQAIGQQRTALKAGDGARALTFATPALRDQFGSADRFMRMVRDGYAPLLAARAAKFLEGAVIEGAVIQPLRLILSDNTVLVAIYQMEKQKDGRWKIAGCVLAPSTVQAT